MTRSAEHLHSIRVIVDKSGLDLREIEEVKYKCGKSAIFGGLLVLKRSPNFGVAASKEDIPTSKCPVFQAFENMHRTSFGNPLPVAIVGNVFGGSLQRAGVILSISPR